MKYILTLIIIGFLSITTQAQKENTAFLEKRAINLLEQESEALEVAITAIESALTQKDNSLMGSNKSRMLKCIQLLTNTCNTMASQVKADRAAIAIKQNLDSDYSEGLRTYTRYKAQSRYKELTIDGAGDVFLTEKAEEIQELWSDIQSKKLEFHPSQKNTVANLESAKSILSTVQQFKSLIQSVIVSE